MEDTYDQLILLWEDIKLFWRELGKWLFSSLHLSFIKLEIGKSKFAAALYKQRGKLAQRFVHSGMAGLAAVGMMIAPVLAEEFPGNKVDPWKFTPTSMVLSATSDQPNISTLISEKTRDKVILYTVTQGDTVSQIAEKFGVSEDTVRWQNNLTAKAVVKVGQTLEILPVTGVSHKVQKGDTVYSIAKKYDTQPQGIVDFPYNTFTNDETFELAIGQLIIVPDGAKQVEGPVPSTRTRQLTPDAGTAVAYGSFVWPASGSITQRWTWYHKGIDIANNSAPGVLAADSGKVILAGWPDNIGYGNRVILDHGNGYMTLYAHLQAIYVREGQSVVRGAAVGKMGSTGRSTGIHLHFEIIQNGNHLNPLTILK